MFAGKERLDLNCKIFKIEKFEKAKEIWQAERSLSFDHGRSDEKPEPPHV